MINDAGIEEYLQEQVGKMKPCTYFYGVKLTSKGKMLLLGNLSPLANKHYIVAMDEKDIVFITMSGMGKLKEYQLLSRQEITIVETKKWLFGMGQKNIFNFSDGSKMVINANKKVLSIKGQKNGLESIRSF